MLAVMRDPNAPPNKASVTFIPTQSVFDGSATGNPIQIELCTELARSITSIWRLAVITGGFSVAGGPSAQPPNASRTAFSTSAALNTPLTYRRDRFAPKFFE